VTYGGCIFLLLCTMTILLTLTLLYRSHRPVSDIAKATQRPCWSSHFWAQSVRPSSPSDTCRQELKQQSSPHLLNPADLAQGQVAAAQAKQNKTVMESQDGNQMSKLCYCCAEICTNPTQDHLQLDIMTSRSKCSGLTGHSSRHIEQMPTCTLSRELPSIVYCLMHR